MAEAQCGTPLSAAEIQTVAALSDTTTIGAGPTLDRLDEAVARNHRIADILASHHDWRGLFDVGLDAVEQSPVLPLQHDAGAFADPEYAHAISYELLRRFLVNLHAEFTGGTPEPHWAWYFQLAGRCDQSPARVAMAGYNAHLTVDLAYAVAAVGSKPENAPDFFHIVDEVEPPQRPEVGVVDPPGPIDDQIAAAGDRVDDVEEVRRVLGFAADRGDRVCEVD
ncbi:DUF5995 family protein, partial [Nocardia sp. 852002-51244_SCH5132740]|uniref:DUF5995 family protein n=1 Tax=Nocardia sp. 852002-51244_SCH5132740 TaxID=1834099 RepID=UPI001E427B75